MLKTQEKRQTAPSAGSRGRGYALAVGACLAATGIRFLTEPTLGVYAPYLPFLLAVVVAARFGGRGPGLVAGVLSALSANYFFIEPRFSLAITDLVQAGSLAAFTIISLVTTLLICGLRDALSASAWKEGILRVQAQLIDLSNDAIIMVDGDHRVISWNTGAAELYGWTEAEAAGHTVDELLSGNRQSIAEARRMLVREGRWEGELVHRGRDGREIVTESRHVVLRDEGGAVTGFLEINRDITGRRQAERSLAASEQRFRDIFSRAPIGISITSPDGRVEHCNQALCTLLGSTEGELAGTPLGSYIHAGDLDAARAADKRLGDGETELVEDECRVMHKGGQPTWTHRIVSVLPGEPGRPPQLMVLLTDITDRKRAEEAVRERERTLRQFTDVAPVAIAMLDRDMRYLAASRRFYDDYSLAGLELIGRSHYEVFPEISGHWREIHERCLAGAIERSDGERFERADGTVQWIRWEIQPWRHPNGGIAGIVLFSEDITQQRNAEQALRESAEQFRTLANAIPSCVGLPMRTGRSSGTTSAGTSIRAPLRSR